MSNEGRTVLDRLKELPEPLQSMALLDCREPKRICDTVHGAIGDISVTEGSFMGEWFWRGVLYFLEARHEDFKHGRITSPKFLEGYNAAMQAYEGSQDEPTVLVSAVELQLLRLKASAFDSIIGVVKKTGV